MKHFNVLQAKAKKYHLSTHINLNYIVIRNKDSESFDFMNSFC